MTMLVLIRAVCLLSVLFAYAGGRTQEVNVNEKREGNQGHEDLLELMVRIAETPEEWDRIHRILNELGRDVKRQSDKAHNLVDARNTLIYKEDDNAKYTASFDSVKENIVHDDMTHQNKEKNGERQEDTKTSFSYKNINKRKHKTPDVSHEVSSDTSWPDFDEAIWNKKRWHFLPKNKDSAENPFSEKWLETGHTSKQHLRHSKYDEFDRHEETTHSTNKHLGNDADTNEVSDMVDDTWEYTVDVNDNKDNELWKENYESNVGNSSIITLEREENKKDGKNVSQNMSVTAENVTNMWNALNFKSNKSHSNKPNFTYHRVTSSPRERHKVNAYIAVSVVRESKTAPQPSPTTAPTEAPWNHARHLHKLQEQLKSISAVKAKLRHHWLDKEYQHAHINKEFYGHQQNLQNRTHH